MEVYCSGSVKFNDLPGVMVMKIKTCKKCSLYKIIAFALSLLSLRVKSGGV